jgi:RNA polymerase sigma-70 factor (ECF subfamily)
LLDLDTLLERCRQGDDLAWEAFVRRYQGRVFGIAVHYMRDREDARDAAQEIFIKVYRHFQRSPDKIPDEGKLLPWLLRLSRNACFDRLRRLKVRRPAGATVPVEDASDVADDLPAADDTMESGSRRALVHRALGLLSDTSREIILLKDIQELKLEEISELLDVPLGTVKSRSSRARVELAKAVQRLDPSYGV